MKGVELMTPVEAIDEISLVGPKDQCEIARYLKQKKDQEEPFSLRLKGRKEPIKVPFAVPPSTTVE